MCGEAETVACRNEAKRKVAFISYHLHHQSLMMNGLSIDNDTFVDL